MTLLLPIVAPERPAHFHQKSLWIRADETILNWSDLIPIALRILNKKQKSKTISILLLNILLTLYYQLVRTNNITNR